MFYAIENRSDTNHEAPYLADTKTNNFPVF
jgi:hypothetical protein